MKERLLGAAVLIAAAVLIIPVFLDGPRPPETVSTQLQLPVPGDDTRAAGETSRTHTVQIKPGRDPGAGSLGADDGAVPPEPVPPANNPVIEPVTAESTPEPTAVTRNSAPAADEPPAEPAPDGRVPTLPVPAATGWAVQVGSFTSESNARRLMEHLKGSAYPAFVVRNVVNGRVMFRVRVGPETEKARAEALVERLKSDRQQTQLVRHP